MTGLNSKIPLCLTLVLGGGLFGLPITARANFGETFNQINARYGQPVKFLQDPDGDKEKATYEYQFNGRRIYVNFMGGKSCGEAIRAPANQVSDKTALAIATQISGTTNWTEMTRSPEEVLWLGSMASANLQHHSDADFVLVMSMKLAAHEIQRENKNVSPDVAARTQAEAKAAQETRVLKWQRQLADNGDPYGEYRMGLRYRDGDGVPKDYDKAREWLQKAAAQGDSDSATALVKLPGPDNIVIFAPTNSEAGEADVFLLSAEFGTSKKDADVLKRLGEMLHTHPDGFTVNAQNLGQDPLPGKKKRLVVRYQYKAADYALTVTGGDEISRQALISNADSKKQLYNTK